MLLGLQGAKLQAEQDCRDAGFTIYPVLPEEVDLWKAAVPGLWDEYFAEYGSPAREMYDLLMSGLK